MHADQADLLFIVQGHIKDDLGGQQVLKWEQYVSRHL